MVRFSTAKAGNVLLISFSLAWEEKKKKISLDS
jgi:hypothetical protein